MLQQLSTLAPTMIPIVLLITLLMAWSFYGPSFVAMDLTTHVLRSVTIFIIILLNAKRLIAYAPEQVARPIQRCVRKRNPYLNMALSFFTIFLFEILISIATETTFAPIALQVSAAFGEWLFYKSPALYEAGDKLCNTAIEMYGLVVLVISWLRDPTEENLNKFTYCVFLPAVNFSMVLGLIARYYRTELWNVHQRWTEKRTQAARYAALEIADKDRIMQTIARLQQELDTIKPLYEKASIDIHDLEATIRHKNSHITDVERRGQAAEHKLYSLEDKTARSDWLQKKDAEANKKLRATCQSLTAENGDLKAQIADEHGPARKLRQQLALSKQEAKLWMEKYQKEKASPFAQATQPQAGSTVKDARIIELEANCAKLKNDNTSLKKTHHALAEMSTPSSMPARNLRLQRECKELTAEVERLRKQQSSGSAVTKEDPTLRQQRAETLRRAGAAEIALAASKKEIAALTDEVVAAEKALEEERATLRALKVEMQEAIAYERERASKMTEMELARALRKGPQAQDEEEADADSDDQADINAIHEKVRLEIQQTHEIIPKETHAAEKEAFDRAVKEKETMQEKYMKKLAEDVKRTQTIKATAEELQTAKDAIANYELELESINAQLVQAQSQAQAQAQATTANAAAADASTQVTQAQLDNEVQKRTQILLNVTQETHQQCEAQKFWLDAARREIEVRKKNYAFTLAQGNASLAELQQWRTGQHTQQMAPPQPQTQPTQPPPQLMSQPQLQALPQIVVQPPSQHQQPVQLQTQAQAPPPPQQPAHDLSQVHPSRQAQLLQVLQPPAHAQAQPAPQPQQPPQQGGLSQQQTDAALAAILQSGNQNNNSNPPRQSRVQQQDGARQSPYGNPRRNARLGGRG